jgi:hypothetical protein
VTKATRLEAIKSAARPTAAEAESPFHRSVPRDKARQVGARTGWNPNPEIGEVRTYVPEPAQPVPRGTRPAPRASDSVLDKAQARRARATPAPPSGAVTGPRLRQGYRPASRVSPPMDVRTSVPQPVTVRTKRTPPQTPPRLRAGAGAPPARWAPPPAPRMAPRTRVGGGRWGAVATAAIHAGTTLAAELKRKERKK